MKRLARSLQAHPRLFTAAAIGAAVGLIAPGMATAVGRCLLAWNTGVWLYLGSVGLMMWRADKGHLQRLAARPAEGALAVLTVVTGGAVASLGAIVVELSAAKAATGQHAWPHLLY